MIYLFNYLLFNYSMPARFCLPLLQVNVYLTTLLWMKLPEDTLKPVWVESNSEKRVC